MNDKTTPHDKGLLRPSRATVSTRKSNGLRPVTEEDVSKVRRDVFRVVDKNIPAVHAVLRGDIKWSNQQVILFKALLNKVLPDLSASFVQKKEERPVENLTRDEILALLKKEEEAERSQRIADEAIDAAYSEVEPDEPAEVMAAKLEALTDE